jgi:regulator of RNase E activity RraA
MNEIARFSSCDISDALAKLGKEYTGHLSKIVPYTATKRIVGPAYTAEFTLDDVATKPSKHHVDSAPTNSIIVIKSPRDAPNAVWGGLMTARAQFIGVQGAVIEGYVRDIQEIREFQFPVWATGQSTMGAMPFSRLVTVDEPILLSQETICPVWVRTGDIIVADEDGVVSVPVDLVDRVVELCKVRTASDAKCMKEIQNGSTLAEAFAKHR